KGEFYFKTIYSKNKKSWFYRMRLTRIIITLNRFRSNHFNHSLSRKNIINDPSCICGYPIQDFPYIIFNYPPTEPYILPLHSALPEPINSENNLHYIIHALHNPSTKICLLFVNFDKVFNRNL
ncbi:hypothetical protein ALC60_09069, partial [Trachymyrmex zeteki]